MEFQIVGEGEIRKGKRICVPQDVELREEILREAYSGRFSIHPRANKMYQDLKTHYWWKGMKRGIAEHVAKCQTC